MNKHERYFKTLLNKLALDYFIDLVFWGFKDKIRSFTDPSHTYKSICDFMELKIRWSIEIWAMMVRCYT